MPTIDTETFQFIALVLLGVIALTGLIALLQLGGLRKALKGLSPGTAPASAEGAAAEQPDAADAGPASNETMTDAAGYSSGIQPLGGADLLDEAAAEARGDAQAAEVARAQQAYQAEQERHAEQAEAERQAQQAGSVAEEPQEQPFERDGRWWFRRGDELLVYEERTGQWVAAPPAGTGVAAAAAEQAPEEQAPVEETHQPQAEETQSEGAHQFPEEPGPFWKCPTCGAVNGSTATSCRMCFTQRPPGVSEQGSRNEGWGLGVRSFGRCSAQEPRDEGKLQIAPQHGCDEKGQP